MGKKHVKNPVSAVPACPWCDVPFDDEWSHGLILFHVLEETGISVAQCASLTDQREDYIRKVIDDEEVVTTKLANRIKYVLNINPTIWFGDRRLMRKAEKTGSNSEENEPIIECKNGNKTGFYEFHGKPSKRYTLV